MISPETVASPFSQSCGYLPSTLPPKMELPPSETLPPAPTTLSETGLFAKKGQRHSFGRYRKIGRLPAVCTQLF